MSLRRMRILNLHFSLTAEIAKTAEKTKIIFFIDQILTPRFFSPFAYIVRSSLKHSVMSSRGQKPE